MGAGCEHLSLCVGAQAALGESQGMLWDAIPGHHWARPPAVVGSRHFEWV